MKRQRGLYCAMGGACIVGMIAAAYFLLRPKSLLDYATRVADASDWKSSYSFNGQAGRHVEFCWLSPTEVLFGVESKDGKLQLMRKRIDQPNSAAVPVPLTIPQDALDWRLSPDCRKLCWAQFQNRNMPARSNTGPYLSTVATLVEDTGQQRRFPDVISIWSDDSASVIYTPMESRDHLRYLNVSSGRTKTISLPSVLPITSGSFTFRGWYTPIRESPNRQLLLAQNGGLAYLGQMDNITLSMYDRKFPDTVIGWPVKAPPGTGTGSARISPRGDRLLWWTFTEIVAAPEKIIHRLFRSYMVHPFQVVQFFVSDLHGDKMHSIAEYQTTVKPQQNDGPDSDVIWSPDGKKVGFVMKGGFYTIPAD